jgi:sugar lactone lactonase YvrE
LSISGRASRSNAPNDVVVHPDGGIWFTDPGYGSMGDYEGKKGDLFIKEEPSTGSTPKTTTLTLVNVWISRNQRNLLFAGL